MSQLLTRTQVEDFLYHEAELLDEWALPAWAALYAEDALYEVTSPASENPRDSDPANALFLISDKIDRIRGRAKRLMSKTAHAEYPHSKTRHLVTNVRVTGGDHGGTTARANFAVYRAKEENLSVFMGEAFYTLAHDGDAIKFRWKRCILDLNSLYHQGRLTIIL
jgi:p-cumate 2,3-dioxygenase subunit beta